MKFNQIRLRTLQNEPIIVADLKSGILKIHHNKKIFAGKKLKTLDCQGSNKVIQKASKDKNWLQFLNDDIEVNSRFCRKLCKKKSILIIKKTENRTLSIQINNKQSRQGQQNPVTRNISKTNNLRRSSIKQNSGKHERVKSNMWQHKQIVRTKKSSISDRLEPIQLQSKKITQQLSIKQLVKPLQASQHIHQALQFKSNLKFNSGSASLAQNQSIDQLNFRGHKRFRTQTSQSISMDLKDYIPRSRQKQMAKEKRVQPQTNIINILKKEDIKFGIGPWITKPNRYQKQSNIFFN